MLSVLMLVKLINVLWNKKKSQDFVIESCFELLVKTEYTVKIYLPMSFNPLQPNMLTEPVILLLDQRRY